MSRRPELGVGLPLFTRAEVMRIARERRRMLMRRVIALGIICGSVLASIAFKPGPLLVWNVSPSMPVGLYYVSTSRGLRRGETVVARLPEKVRSLASERGYLPANVPLVKRVSGIAGDEICAFDTRITVNGTLVGTRREFDTKGRRLPFWLGCVRLREQEVFLLSDHPDSFDGRYFGLSETSDLYGKAKLIWRR